MIIMIKLNDSNNNDDDLLYRLALWVNILADDILKYVFLFSQKTGFDISSKLSP